MGTGLGWIDILVISTWWVVFYLLHLDRLNLLGLPHLHLLACLRSHFQTGWSHWRVSCLRISIRKYSLHKWVSPSFGFGMNLILLIWIPLWSLNFTFHVGLVTFSFIVLVLWALCGILGLNLFLFGPSSTRTWWLNLLYRLALVLHLNFHRFLSPYSCRVSRVHLDSFAWSFFTFEFPFAHLVLHPHTPLVVTRIHHFIARIRRFVARIHHHFNHRILKLPPLQIGVRVLKFTRRWVLTVELLLISLDLFCLNLAFMTFVDSLKWIHAF